jgi:site-specific recombinase
MIKASIVALEKCFTRKQKIEGLALVAEQMRPGAFDSKHVTRQRFKSMMHLLKSDAHVKYVLARTIFQVIESSELEEWLADSGLPSSSNFFEEIFARLRHKILPELVAEGDIQYAIQNIFNDPKDYVWINDIPEEDWISFFTVFSDLKQGVAENVLLQLKSSLKILSTRVASLGLEPEIRRQMGATEYSSTFFQLQHFTDRFLESTGDKQQLLEIKKELRATLMSCGSLLHIIEYGASETGTSIRQTYLIRKIQLMAGRIFILVDILDGDNELNLQRMVSFFKESIYNANNRHAIREFISQNLQTISYQISEHKSKSGEHYITSTIKEYSDFFYESCKGGFIISFVVIIKVLIHHAHFAPLWEAVAFSLNYAIAFIIIHITHSTLATKQPAMTASRIAANLDSRNVVIELKELAITIGSTSRSQLVSFAGNLVVIFPLTYLLAYLITLALGRPLIAEHEAREMMVAMHPFQSLSLFYACIAGVFLFIGGVISGYWDNKVVYSRIPERLLQSKSLKKLLSGKQIHKLAAYLDNNMGSIVGNFALGFFLGSAAFIGSITGLPFDIRHITISSGNFSLGAFTLLNKMSWQVYLTCFAGVLGIGFFNFLVSFSIAFYVALKSRNISLIDHPEFLSVLFRYLRKYPMDFILPSKKVRSAEDLD